MKEDLAAHRSKLSDQELEVWLGVGTKLRTLPMPAAATLLLTEPASSHFVLQA